ncbi:MAG: tRNA (guanosine(46)-N7)-methyltransferase TrmB [Candidatus Eisenbacteria sp.]|nr:tRNA (guanosine(46)-N7)-methyltransferase TrmB [Candidatus Eisenbacteria bacterium]
MLLSSIEIAPTALVPPFNWSELYGNNHPVELELGCGKGMFLKEAARLNPGVNYLGIERAGRYYRQAVTRLTRTGLTNIRFMQADALDVMDRWIPPQSIQTIHVYFPDPWPKKRHHKRHIIRPELLALAARSLVDNGEFRVATDHGVYGAAIRNVFSECAPLFASLPWQEDSPDRLPTNYALKWQRVGRTSWWARFQRRPGEPGRTRLA